MKRSYLVQLILLFGAIMASLHWFRRNQETRFKLALIEAQEFPTEVRNHPGRIVQLRPEGTLKTRTLPCYVDVVEAVYAGRYLLRVGSGLVSVLDFDCREVNGFSGAVASSIPGELAVSGDAKTLAYFSRNSDNLDALRIVKSEAMGEPRELFHLTVPRSPDGTEGLQWSVSMSANGQLVVFAGPTGCGKVDVRKAGWVHLGTCQNVAVNRDGSVVALLRNGRLSVIDVTKEWERPVEPQREFYPALLTFGHRRSILLASEKSWSFAPCISRSKLLAVDMEGVNWGTVEYPCYKLPDFRVSLGMGL